eukprot:4452796-Amphidinium_carterae.1
MFKSIAAAFIAQHASLASLKIAIDGIVGRLPEAGTSGQAGTNRASSQQRRHSSSGLESAHGVNTIVSKAPSKLSSSGMSQDSVDFNVRWSEEV